MYYKSFIKIWNGGWHGLGELIWNDPHNIIWWNAFKSFPAYLMSLNKIIYENFRYYFWKAGTCFPQGERGKCPIGAPQIDYPLE